MTLLALGLNHHTAPVALRERLAFRAERKAEALGELSQLREIDETAILTTCNRTELYCKMNRGNIRALIDWLHQYHGLLPDTADDFLYAHLGDEAVRHLFRVASGLDSMVVGEPQILGQVKDAYFCAREAGTIHVFLERLFQSAFATAKRVRHETQIGANPVSVAFIAAKLAEKIFGDLQKSTALLIGAGDTVELVATHLRQLGVGRLLIANRTLANAQTLAAAFGGQAIALGDIAGYLAKTDIVIASAASATPLLTREAAQSAQAERRHRPLLVIDLAVPRNVESSVGELQDTYLYTIDDLSSIAQENSKSRQQAAAEAETIVKLQAEHFMSWVKALDGHDVLARFRQLAETTKEDTLLKAKAMLRQGKDAEAVLGFFANTITGKLLHLPTVNIRAAAMRGDRELLNALGRIFDNPPADDKDHDPLD